MNDVGIFAMDPGGHTGLAWGVFDPMAPLTEAIAKGLSVGSATVVGDEYEQIAAIADAWTAFYRGCVLGMGMDPGRVEFVSEDFIQRPNSRGGKEGQSPLRILWGVEGYRMGRAAEFKGRQRSAYRIHAPRAILQHPSLGSAIDSDRLRAYGCWVVGKEHERSAWRHIIVRLGQHKKRPQAGRRQSS